MKKLLIATVLTAAFGIGGVTFASTNDVQNNNEPIKMNLLVERNHDDANSFEDKKCDMLLENQNNQMHRQDRMEHMPMNHHVDNMHRKDNDQSMRPECQNHQMRQQCNIFSHNTFRVRGHESAFMATVEPYTLRDTFVSESLSYTQ
ncbi:MAG: hypothetical protein E7C93_07760 [Veillonella sp.]|nr:hypothetical protein [Veillonella sp.]